MSQTLTMWVPPSAPGDVQELTLYPNGGEAAWQDVDENPGGAHDGDTSYLYQTTAAEKKALFRHAAVVSGAITAVRIHMFFKSTGTGNAKYLNCRPLIKIAGVEYGTQVNQIDASVYTTISQEWLTNPATGGAWSQAALDNLQFGFGIFNWAAFSQQARCTQCYMQVTSVSSRVRGGIGMTPAMILLAQRF